MEQYLSYWLILYSILLDFSKKKKFCLPLTRLILLMGHNLQCENHSSQGHGMENGFYFGE